MYTHEVKRLEFNKNHAGDIVSIFVSIHVSQDDNVFNQEYFLEPDEIAAVVADQTALDPILAKVAALGEVNLEKIINNSPQPPVIFDKASLDSFSIDKDKVAESKTQIIMEQEQEIQTALENATANIIPEPMPVEEAPVEEAPAEPTPDAPAEPAPGEPAPAEEPAPQEEAPAAEPAPAEVAPEGEVAPAEAPAEQA